MKNRKHPLHVCALASMAGLSLLAPAGMQAQSGPVAPTDTPIKHVVVIFQENISFDHYFATYPHAANPNGETKFHARVGTPIVNGLESAGIALQQPELGESVPAVAGRCRHLRPGSWLYRRTESI